MQRLDNGRGDDNSGKPFVVAGHHVPGGVLGGRFLNQGLAGFHVTAPEVALSSHLGNFIM